MRLGTYSGKSIFSDKRLSQNLKELEKDDLIHREVYPQIPPKAEYSLTQRGASLMKVLDQLCVWAKKIGDENILHIGIYDSKDRKEKMNFNQQR